MESGSGSEHIEGVSGNEQENEQQPKKKRYHRHTARQIQEMEAYATISLSLSSKTWFLYFNHNPITHKMLGKSPKLTL